MLSKGIACRVCSHREGEVCHKGYTIAIHEKEDCWCFRHKEDKLNLGTRGKESLVVRLEDMWKF